MKFGRQILSPSYTRPADYNSAEGGGNRYSFECSRCASQISFPYTLLIGSELSWTENYEDYVVQQIRAYFDMNVVGKSPDGGWPSIIEVDCSACGARHLIYAGVTESRNSVYSVVIQSIVEVESN